MPCAEFTAGSPLQSAAHGTIGTITFVAAYGHLNVVRRRYHSVFSVHHRPRADSSIATRRFAVGCSRCRVEGNASSSSQFVQDDAVQELPPEIRKPSSCRKATRSSKSSSSSGQCASGSYRTELCSRQFSSFTTGQPVVAMFMPKLLSLAVHDDDVG